MNCLSSASIKANFTHSYSISGVVDTQRLIFPNLFFVLFPCFSVPSVSFVHFFGPVVSILSGDTLEVLHNTRAERIRLNGIDCPERDQAFGKKAKQSASDLIFGKQVTLKTYGLDKYGRTMADVLLPDGTNVNHELVKEGWCWWYRKYAPGDVILEESETRARASRMGLWADPHPIPPWVYRKAKREYGA